MLNIDKYFNLYHFKHNIIHFRGLEHIDSIYLYFIDIPSFRKLFIQLQNIK